jgi:hypothetical protein
MEILMSEMWEEKARQLERYAAAKLEIGHNQDQQLNHRIANLLQARDTCRMLETLEDAK